MLNLNNIGYEDKIVPWTDDIVVAVMHLMVTNREILMTYIHKIDSISFGQDGIYDNMLSIIKKHIEQRPNTMPRRSYVIDDLREMYSGRGELGNALRMAHAAYDYELHAEETEIVEDKLKKFLVAKCLEGTMTQYLKDIVEAKNSGKSISIDKMFSELREVEELMNRNEQFVNYFETYRDRLKSASQMQENAKRFTTGFKTIDQKLLGGIGVGEIGIFCGDSGSGKSQILTHIAVQNILAGNNVLYISVENLQSVIERRFDACISSIPMNAICDVPNDVIMHIDSFRSSGAGTGRLETVCYPMASVTISQIRVDVERMLGKSAISGTPWKPDVVVLDYLDEIKEVNSDKYIAQGDTTRDFRQWMQEMHSCGYTATQTNRSGRDKYTMDRTNVADSYGKVRKTDCMWTINVNEEEKACGVCRIWAEKHRNGEANFTVYCRADYGRCTFNEITSQEYESRKNNVNPATNGQRGVVDYSKFPRQNIN